MSDETATAMVEIVRPKSMGTIIVTATFTNAADGTPKTVRRFVPLTSSATVESYAMEVLFGIDPTTVVTVTEAPDGIPTPIPLDYHATTYESILRFPPGSSVAISATRKSFADARICDACKTHIGSPCWECGALHGCSDFDLCSSCAAGCDVKNAHNPRHVFVPRPHPPKPRTYLRARSLYETLSLALANYSVSPVFGQRPRVDDPYAWISCSTFYDRAHDLGSGLAATLAAQEAAAQPIYAGIMAPNSIAWLLAEFAATSRAYVTVPLHTSYTNTQLEHIMSVVPLSVVLCARDLVPRLASLLVAARTAASAADPTADLPPHVHIVALDDAFAFRGASSYAGAAPVVADPPPIHASELGLDSTDATDAAVADVLHVVLASELEAAGSVAPVAPRTPNPKDLSSIVFTSGSTGMPKGVTVSQDAAHRELDAYCETFTIEEPYVTVETSPFAWMTGRDESRTSIMYGGSMAIFSRPMAQLLDDLQEISPTVVRLMPAVWGRIFASFKTVVSQLEAAALDDDAKAAARAAAIEAFNPVLGTRVQTLVTGGAHTPAPVVAFLKETWPDASFWNGYGTSEAGGIAINGLLLPGVEVRLIPVPEMGYLPTDDPPRGEVWVRTNIMTDGYFRDPENTSARLKDGGWFATGDIGVMPAPDALELIDRRAAVFKLATGEFIAPSMIEEVLVACPLVKDIFVYGDMTRSALIAVVVPDLEILGDEPEPARSRALLRGLRTFAVNAGLSTSNIPQAVLIELEPFTPEAGLLTPSGKICRPGLSTHYAQQIEAMYLELDEPGAQLSTPKAADVGAPSRQAFPDDDADAAAASASASEATLAALRAIVGSCITDGVSAADSSAADSASLVELGVSSADTIRVLSAVQSQLATQLPLDLVYEGLTLEEMAQYIDASGDAATPSTPTASALANRSKSRKAYDEDFEAYVRRARDALGDALVVADGDGSSDKSSRVVLVTGATGFLGRYLADALVGTDGVASVTVLVRAESQEHAQQRMAAAATESQLAALAAGLGDGRVRVVVGNLGAPNLGLDDALYADLAGCVTDVIHCGAKVSWVQPYSQLRKANVVGTLDVVRFCGCTTAKRLTYVSTLSAAASLREERSPPQYFSAARGYAASKHMGELVVDAAARLGVAACIVRPGMIVADPATGWCQSSDFVPRFIAGCMALGSYPAPLPGKFEMTPVTLMAKTIVQVATADSAFDRVDAGSPIYHIATPGDQCLSYAEVGAAVSAAAPEGSATLTPLPHKQWVAALRNAGDANPLTTLIDFVADPAFFQDINDTSTARLAALLHKDGGAIVHTDDAWGVHVVEGYVKFLTESVAEASSS